MEYLHLQFFSYPHDVGGFPFQVPSAISVTARIALDCGHTLHAVNVIGTAVSLTLLQLTFSVTVSMTKFVPY